MDDRVDDHRDQDRADQEDPSGTDPIPDQRVEPFVEIAKPRTHGLEDYASDLAVLAEPTGAPALTVR